MDLFGPTGKVSKISVNHFSRLERPDRKGLFHLTIPTYSQSQYLAVRYFPCETWKKTIIIVALWIYQFLRIYQFYSYIHVQLQQVCS